MKRVSRVTMLATLTVLLPVWPARERRGELRVQTRPASTRVFIDGQFAGRLRSFLLPSGHHVVQLDSGRAESIIPLELMPGEVKILVVDLN